MLWLVFGLTTIISLVILAIGILRFIDVDANLQRHFAKVETGGFKFVVAGESLVKILDNLSGKTLDENWKVVRGKRKQTLVERLFGVYWVSLIYPLKKIHKFQIVADKLLPENERTRKPVREWIKKETKEVTYLRHQFTHPFSVLDIELKNGWKVDLVGTANIESVGPGIVVFDYKGKVLIPLDAAIAAVINDHYNGVLDYPTAVAEEKGTKSSLAKEIMSLNGSTSPSEARDGLESNFGIKITAAWIEGFDLSPEQKDLDEAAKAVDKARLKAEEKVKTAEGDRDAIKARADGEMSRESKIGEGRAQAYQKLVKALIDLGVNPNIAAKAAEADAVSRNIGGSATLRTYVADGSRSNVQVSIQDDNSK